MRVTFTHTSYIKRRDSIGTNSSASTEEYTMNLDQSSAVVIGLKRCLVYTVGPACGSAAVEPGFVSCNMHHRSASDSKCKSLANNSQRRSAKISHLVRALLCPHFPLHLNHLLLVRIRQRPRHAQQEHRCADDPDRLATELDTTLHPRRPRRQCRPDVSPVRWGDDVLQRD